MKKRDIFYCDFDKISFRLLLSWVLMPIFILVGQACRLDQIIGNLFLMYITVLGTITLFFVFEYVYKSYQVNSSSYFRHIFKKQPWNLMLLLMLIWSFIASLLADDWQLAFYGTAYRNEGFFTYCIYAGIYSCALINNNKEHSKKVLPFFLLASIPLCLVTVLQYFNYSTDFFGIYYRERLLSNMRYAAIFYNTNHYGYYLALIIAVACGMYLTSKKTSEQTISLLTFTLNAWCLMINNTFGCYLSVLLLCIISPFLFFKASGSFKKIKSLMPLIIFILLTVSSSQLVSNNFQTLFSDVNNIAAENSAAKNAGSKRWELWTNGLVMLKDRPVFGYGPENLGKEYLIRGIDQDRPHNEYLQHALFLGVPALIFYITAIFLLLKKWLKSLQQMDAVTFVSGIAIIAYFCSAFFGNTMFYTTIYLLLLLGNIAQNKI